MGFGNGTEYVERIKRANEILNEYEQTIKQESLSHEELKEIVTKINESISNGSLDVHTTPSLKRDTLTIGKNYLRISDLSKAEVLVFINKVKKII